MKCRKPLLVCYDSSLALPRVNALCIMNAFKYCGFVIHITVNNGNLNWWTCKQYQVITLFTSGTDLWKVSTSQIQLDSVLAWNNGHLVSTLHVLSI